MAGNVTNDKTQATQAGGRITVPEGEILVRKVRGAEGPLDLVGPSRIGRVYTVALADAARLIAGGEFELVYADDQARLDALRPAKAGG